MFFKNLQNKVGSEAIYATDSGNGTFLAMEHLKLKNPQSFLAHVDGTATVFAGTTEIGQGSRGVLAQVASQELQVPFEQVGMVSSDTGVVPYDRSTGSSRSTTMMGLAVQGAAKEVKEQLLELAALHFDCSSEELSVENGLVMRGGESVTYGALIEEEFGGRAGELLGRGYVTPRRDNGRLRQSPAFWEVGIAAAQIVVDTETGLRSASRSIRTWFGACWPNTFVPVPAHTGLPG